MITFILFLVIFFLQMLVGDLFARGGMITPILSFTAILMLPINMNKSLQLFLAFIFGLVIDFYFGTPGVNTTSFLIVAMIRILLIGSVTESKQKLLFLSAETVGEYKLRLLVLIVLIVGQTLTYFLESMGSISVFDTFLKILINSLFAIPFTYIYMKLSVSIISR